MVIEGPSVILPPAVGIGIFVKDHVGDFDFGIISVVLNAFAAVIAYF